MSRIMPSLGCVFWGEWNRDHLEAILSPLWSDKPLGGVIHPSILPYFPWSAKPVTLADCSFESLAKLAPDITMHDWLESSPDPEKATVNLDISLAQNGQLLVLGDTPLEQAVCRGITEQITHKKLLQNMFPRKILWAMPYTSSLPHSRLLNNFRMFSIIPLFLVDRQMPDEPHPMYFTKNHSWPPEARVPPWLLEEYRKVFR